MNNDKFADISSNNSRFNVAAYASARYAAIAIKATEGTGYVNPRYAEWVLESHRHNLAVFHYHFCRPEHGEPRTEAAHFWKHIDPHFRRPGDYVVADVETGDPVAARRWLLEFDSHLKMLSGTHPICYTYISYLESGNLELASNNFWIASYNRSRPGNWRWKLGNRNVWAWQYTDGQIDPSGQPAIFAGIGHSDGSVLNPTVTRGLNKGRRPR